MLTLFRGYLRSFQGPALFFHGGLLVPQVTPGANEFQGFTLTVLKAQNSTAWGKTPGNIHTQNIALKERYKVSIEQPWSPVKITISLCVT
jgi:hypothetical protein